MNDPDQPHSTAAAAEVTVSLGDPDPDRAPGSLDRRSRVLQRGDDQGMAQVERVVP
jgi:hypothetical protein